MTTYDQLYSNLYSYPLYIGICLLLMIIYSVIYLLLAIYIERINPGEFGVSQPWNYPLKLSYWKPHTTSTIRPLGGDDKSVNRNDGSDNWIELNSVMNRKSPSLTISHLTKVCVRQMFGLSI
jgi:hypothetical protein